MKRIILLLLCLVVFASTAEALSIQSILNAATDVANGRLRLKVEDYDSTANTVSYPLESLYNMWWDNTSSALTVSFTGSFSLGGAITGTVLSATADSNQIVLDSDGTYTTTITDSAATSSKTITLPNVTGTLYITGGTDVALADGGTGIDASGATDGQLLIGGTTSNDLQLATLTGTANQVTVANGTNSITLSTPQDIDATATPEFASVQVTDNTTAAYTLSLDSDSTVALDADRTLTIDVNNTDPTLTLTGDLTVESASTLDQDLTQDADVEFNRVDATDFEWQDEFVVEDKPQWTTNVTTGSVAVVAGSNGIQRLTTGATGTNEESLDWNDLTAFVNTLRPVLEVRFQLEQITNIEAQIGLTEVSGGGGDDYLVFAFDASAANTWSLVASAGGSATSDAGAIADTDMHVFRLEWNSDTEAEWYIDGVSQGTVATNIPTVALQPLLAVWTEEAAAHYIDVDYVKFWQDRE